MTDRLPALEHFLGAYLHQDWDIVLGDEWRALDSFLRHSPALAIKLSQEIKKLVNNSEDAEIDEYLNSQRSCYTAKNSPGGERGWLLEVARKAELGPDDSLLPLRFTEVGDRPQETP